MRKFVLLAVVLSLGLISCAPAQLEKCVTEFSYDSNGKVSKEYKECITQTPSKVMPINLKHQELYE